MNDDLVLLERARKGDEASLEKLIDIFKPTVSSIVRSYFLNDGDNDDLIQEAMIGLYKAIQSYNDKAGIKFSTYAYSCIKHKVQSAVRSSLSGKNSPLNACLSISNQGKLLIGNEKEEENDEEHGIFLASNELSPEEKFFEQERKLEITNAIKRVLSEYEYNVLKLYLKGYSYLDIAKKLGKDNKSIDNAISRLKQKLQVVFEGGEICI